MLIGPLTYLYLGKETQQDFNRLDLLPHLLSVYREILAQLAFHGVEWVQIDEPLLALDLNEEWLHGLDQAYFVLGNTGPLPKLLLATYFEAVDNHAERLKKLSVDAARPASSILFSTVIQRRKCCHWASSTGAMCGVRILRKRSPRYAGLTPLWEKGYGLRLVVRFCIAQWISSRKRAWSKKSRAGWPFPCRS